MKYLCSCSTNTIFTVNQKRYNKHSLNKKCFSCSHFLYPFLSFRKKNMEERMKKVGTATPKKGFNK